MAERFILELKLQTNAKDERELDKRFFLASRVKNILVSHGNKCLNRLRGDHHYHDLRQQYHSLHKAIIKAGKAAEDGALSPESAAQLKKDEAAIATVKDEINAILEDVGLTKTAFEKYAKVQQHRYSTHLDAQCVQVIANEVLAGVKSILYQSGKRLHYNKVMETYSISGKTNKQGIRFRNNRVEWQSLSIGVQLRKGDLYARAALAHKVKLCRITRKMVGTRWHYYVQLVLEGVPPVKHRPGIGEVGIDNGTSVFAVSTDTGLVAFEKLGVDTGDLDTKIVQVQQAIDRSIRVSNPGNYDPDGTVKKGRKRWVYSRRCKVLRRRLKSLNRKKAARLKQKNEMLANRLLAMGNRFITEPVKLRALQRRAKETKLNPKTGRPHSKKRYGKSIARHSPGAVIDALNRKAGYFGLCVEKVNLPTYRASQYDHINDTYKRKTLKERWARVGSFWVQRDLYSSFLLRCPNKTLDQIDRAKCVAQFAAFLKAHNAYIKNLMESENHMPSCCGIHKKKAA